MEDLKPKYLEACKYLLDTSRITQELYNNYKDKIDNYPVEKLGQFVKKFNELTQENPSFDSLISNNEIHETNYEVSDSNINQNSKESLEDNVIYLCNERKLDDEQTEQVLDAIKLGITDNEFFNLLINPKNTEGVMHAAYRNFKAGDEKIIKKLLSLDTPLTEDGFLDLIEVLSDESESDWDSKINEFLDTNNYSKIQEPNFDKDLNPIPEEERTNLGKNPIYVQNELDLGDIGKNNTSEIITNEDNEDNEDIFDTSSSNQNKLDLDLDSHLSDQLDINHKGKVTPEQLEKLKNKFTPEQLEKLKNKLTPEQLEKLFKSTPEEERDLINQFNSEQKELTKLYKNKESESNINYTKYSIYNKLYTLFYKIKIKFTEMEKNKNFNDLGDNLFSKFETLKDNFSKYTTENGGYEFNFNFFKEVLSELDKEQLNILLKIFNTIYYELINMSEKYSDPSLKKEKYKEEGNIDGTHKLNINRQNYKDPLEKPKDIPENERVKFNNTAGFIKDKYGVYRKDDTKNLNTDFEYEKTSKNRLDNQDSSVIYEPEASQDNIQPELDLDNNKNRKGKI